MTNTPPADDTVTAVELEAHAERVRTFMHARTPTEPADEAELLRRLFRPQQPAQPAEEPPAPRGPVIPDAGSNPGRYTSSDLDNLETGATLAALFGNH